ncbi:lysylphosphatidylglycerol synthase domain-containing protein [Plantactinospora sp. CA-290183]|uniref:lysylphosphatidylglycerol synthase domain-containing protein n=1 Tax=Plantactinospora sp. CA-290183 TaxID=3240006 RepID=UPI003D8B823C
MPRTFSRPPLRRAGQVAVTAAFLGFLGWSLAGRWSEVREVADDLSGPVVALAGVAAAVAGGCGFLAWRAVLADLGAVPPVTGALRIFYVGQLAKYLPGKVWPIVVQARLGRAYRVPGRASAAAAMLVMLVTLGTGLLLTALLLPVLGGGALDRFWWTLLALPPAALVLWPPLANRVITRLLRLARREPLPRPLTARGIVRAAGWSVATWLAYGVHLWLLLRDVGAGGGTELLLRSVGAFAGSWSVGFLLAVAPAGLGPREVALPLLLGATVGQPAALVAAVVSRLLMTIVDLAAPAVAVAAERFRRGASARPGALPTGTPPPSVPAPSVPASGPSSSAPSSVESATRQP